MTGFQFLIIFICSILWIGIAVSLIYAWLFHTPFYPSNPKKLKSVFDELNIDLRGKNFLDLGSGDGRVVVWAVKNGMSAEGIEINPYLSLLSKLRIKLNRASSKAKILNKNFKNHNFSKYDIVYTYIFKEYIDEIEDKLFNQMKPGSVIISKIFKFSNRQVDKKIGEFNIYFVEFGK
jgi:ribosomal protein L11 methylase PrmA